MNTSIIILGSNIEPQKNISLAKRLISHRFLVLNESRFLRTRAIGPMDQPDFINGALFIETELDREVFQLGLKEIEFRMGRTKNATQKYGPRIIDIDILAWNDQVVSRDFYEREFVRSFVLEMAPVVQY